MKKKNIFFWLFILIVIGAILRFYNLNWGAPFYFHPDERNIASAVSGLEFPANLNPRFFAYGSLPIYTIYFTGVAINFFSNCQMSIVKCQLSNVNFEQAILISRFFSALFSLALIPLLFFIGKKLKDTRTGLIAAFFAAFSTGFIQFAHFGTFEMWLTFFSVLLFWLCLKLLETKRFLFIFFLGIVFGILIAIKISHLVLLPLLIFTLFFKNAQSFFEKSHLSRHSERNDSGVEESHTTDIHKKHSGMRSTTRALSTSWCRLHFGRDDKKTNLIIDILLFLGITILIFFITNPFAILDYSSFIGSMHYESGVALGTLPVFYTGEFRNAAPVIFQFLHIYPFLLNPLLTILFIPAFFYLLFISIGTTYAFVRKNYFNVLDSRLRGNDNRESGIKTKNSKYLILNTFFLILFLSQAFLYAKWTRYMAPTLPFMYLIISISLSEFIARSKSSASGTPKISPNPSLIKRGIEFSYSLVKRGSESVAPAIIGGWGIWVGGIFVCITILFSISYFVTAFVQKDTRVAAKIFAKQRVPSNAAILSEVYDLGITPFNDSFSNITLFNFYDLDNKSSEYSTNTLAQQLAVSDYIILPSQRILKTRLNDPKTYPLAYSFYSALFAQVNGFKEIYETPCDLFCRITYLNNPVFSFEETANVFDRPTVYIFEKIKN